tara:strand:- start:67 stop:1227 length:1161 start_codon:yes stop_codon:yes gene_type:complete
MADTLYFSRDTRVFINKGTQVWELPVLDGFSFSQSTNSSEITLSEMSDASGNSRRGRQMFNDSFAPAEWSFSTYARPFASAGGTLGTASAAGVYPASATATDQHAVEEVLWAQLVGAGTWSAGDFVNCTSDATDLDISFANSNKTTLGEVDIYFVMGGAKTAGAKTTYQITGCVVNEAALDFDIDGITTIAWSGTGKKLTDITGTAVSAAGLATTGVITPTINEGIESTSNFIRNRITNLGVATAMGSPHPSSYNLVLTGGSINISNNMTYLTPETLGVINQPLGAVTGTRTVGGSFTCYLNAEDDSSAELFDNISSDLNTITNVFDLTFNVGGETAPFVQLSMEKCHLELPTHAIDDVISVEVNFHALPSNIETADEISIIYKGA